MDAAWGWEAEKEKWERRVIERETAQLKKEPDYFKKRLHEMKTVCDNHAQANQVSLADIFNPPLSQLKTKPFRYIAPKTFKKNVVPASVYHEPSAFFNMIYFQPKNSSIMSQCSMQQKHQIWVINPARST